MTNGETMDSLENFQALHAEVEMSADQRFLTADGNTFNILTKVRNLAVASKQHHQSRTMTVSSTSGISHENSLRFLLSYMLCSRTPPEKATNQLCPFNLMGRHFESTNPKNLPRP
jgi:hypothetical protein